MESFSIYNSISKYQYRKFILKRMYHQPVIILFTVFGCLSVLVSLIYYADLIPGNKFTLPLIAVVYLGSFTAALPFIIRLHANSSYDKSEFLNSVTIYQFNQEEIIVRKEGTEKKIPWQSVKKTEEMKDLILIFTSNAAGELLNKATLTNEQIAFIKTKGSHKGRGK